MALCKIAHVYICLATHLSFLEQGMRLVTMRNETLTTTRPLSGLSSSPPNIFEKKPPKKPSFFSPGSAIIMPFLFFKKHLLFNALPKPVFLNRCAQACPRNGCRIEKHDCGAAALKAKLPNECATTRHVTKSILLLKKLGRQVSGAAAGREGKKKKM